MTQTLQKIILLTVVATTVIACGQAPEDVNLQNATAHYIIPDGKIQANDTILNQILEEIKQTTLHAQELAKKSSIDPRGPDTIDVALSALKSPRLEAALIEAATGGVSVRVVGDISNQSTFTKLINASQTTPNLKVVLADNDLKYLPSVDLLPYIDRSKGYIYRESALNKMVHNFLLIGKTTVWNFATPIDDTTPPLGYQIKSQLLREDFTREFNQLFVGVDSTNLDTYSGPVKSLVFSHPYANEDGYFYYKDSIYTDQGRLRLLFSPQSRPIKSTIDEIYKAKGSVYVQSNAICDPNLLKALIYKMNYGFTVRVVIGNEQEQCKEGVALASDATALATNLDNKIKQLGTNVKRLSQSIPTVVLIDHWSKNNQPKPQYPRTAIVLNFPLYNASSIYINNRKAYPIASDDFVDGNGWIIKETASLNHKDKTIDSLVWLFIRSFGG